MTIGVRWTRGPLPRIAVIALVLAATGALPGGAADARTAAANLTYDCRFPSGVRQVGVRVTASLPSSGTAGQTIQPGEPTVTVTVPRPALADVAAGAATVSATERLTVDVAEPGGPAAGTEWRDLTAAQTALPQAGDLVLTATGTAPAARPAVAGRAAFVAGPLDIELTSRNADGTGPSTISLSCTPVGGADATIGAVAISGAAASAVSRQAAADICPPPAPTEFNPRFPLPPVPPGLSATSGPGLQDCAVVSGFSNVNKLGGASPVGGIGSVAEGLRSVASDDSPNYLDLDNVVLTHFAPKQTTLLTFGFVPVSATMELTQLGPMNISTVGVEVQPPPPATPIPLISDAFGEVSLRLSNAKVNGVPLDLGPDCRGDEPITLHVHGSTDNDPPYLIDQGGMLTGDITIPPFTGCGVGEDLDPLLTATVSGPDNFVQVLQGPLCDPGNGSQLGKPCPPQPYGFTVRPGGQWTATATAFATRQQSLPRLAVSCQSVTVDGTFKSGGSLSGTGIGKVTGADFGGCSETAPQTGTFTITPRDLPWKLDAEDTNPATGVTRGHFENATLHFSTDGCSFDLSDPQANAGSSLFNFSYANATHELTLRMASAPPPDNLNVTALTTSNVTGCTGFSRPFRDGARFIFASDISFDPPQTITEP